MEKPIWLFFFVVSKLYDLVHLRCRKWDPHIYLVSCYSVFKVPRCLATAFIVYIIFSMMSTTFSGFFISVAPEELVGNILQKGFCLTQQTYTIISRLACQALSRRFFNDTHGLVDYLFRVSFAPGGHCTFRKNQGFSSSLDGFPESPGQDETRTGQLLRCPVRVFSPCRLVYFTFSSVLPT